MTDKHRHDFQVIESIHILSGRGNHKRNFPCPQTGPVIFCVWPHFRENLKYYVCETTFFLIKLHQVNPRIKLKLDCFHNLLFSIKTTLSINGDIQSNTFCHFYITFFTSSTFSTYYVIFFFFFIKTNPIFLHKSTLEKARPNLQS